MLTQIRLEPYCAAANTNRCDSPPGFTYDKKEYLKKDPTELERSFVFNGDNKQSEVKRDGVTIGRYFYDGEGRRVKKVTDAETTVFVYSAGKLIAEYSTQLSQSPSIAYTTTDHLGTPRVITDQFGQVKARRDFMPFGEELYTGIGGRTGDTGLKYSSSQDDIRQKFTGYQKDNETGLDFAEARMYENRFGRFTAVDPLLASGKSTSPQTFNRYAYTSNNPVIPVDRNGLEWRYTSNKIGDGDRTRTIYTPVWIERPLPEGTVPRGEPNYEGKWSSVMPYVYQIGAGDSTGRWGVLDPNSGNTAIFQNEVFARIQFDVYTGKISEWEATLATFDALNTNMVRAAGDSTSLVRSVANHPQAAAFDRVTNPDGVQLNASSPFGIAGGSVWLTRDFDYGYSTSFSGSTPSDVVNGLRDPNFNPFSLRNLMGGVSANATYIAGQDRDSRITRLPFFVGRSVSGSVSYLGSVGGSFTDPDSNGNRRYSFNPGIGSPSVNVNISYGTCLGNLWKESKCPR